MMAPHLGLFFYILMSNNNANKSYFMHLQTISDGKGSGPHAGTTLEGSRMWPTQLQSDGEIYRQNVSLPIGIVWQMSIRSYVGTWLELGCHQG